MGDADRVAGAVYLMQRVTLTVLLAVYLMQRVTLTVLLSLCTRCSW